MQFAINVPNFGALLSDFAEAGVTWWQEGFWGTNTVDDAHRRIQQGPPHLR